MRYMVSTVAYRMLQHGSLQWLSSGVQWLMALLLCHPRPPPLQSCFIHSVQQQASLEALRLLSLAPLARRAVVAAAVPAPGGAGGGGRSGVGVLLNASILSTSAFFTSDPEVHQKNWREKDGSSVAGVVA